MDTATAISPVPAPAATGTWRAGLDLFLISLLVLFLELACIRWFPAHVLFLTFFTNTVLLACFLGMSVGCLAARQRRNYLAATPLLLTAALGLGHLVLATRYHAMLGQSAVVLDVGHQEHNPDHVFFGTEHTGDDVARFVIPIEVVAGGFFLLLALTLVGPGQELGRALNRLPNRVAAYTINIGGSIAGIVLFALFSWWQLSPLWWFLPVVVLVGYYLLPRPLTSAGAWRWGLQGALLLFSLCLADLSTGRSAPPGHSPLALVRDGMTRVYYSRLVRQHRTNNPSECLWSPYYRIDYQLPPNRTIDVNLIGHQQMHARSEIHPQYDIPYLLEREAKGPPFKDVLVIGAGSGNDVSHALGWGAEHIDAVEIDPVILALGRQDHPDRPYQDKRVTPHLDDGRNFLRSTGKKYDLIVYALVDSLVLHSSYSNIRLESYLFTRQAFEDVKRCLKPGGVFVTYNYFRQDWVVSRLHQGLEEVFGAGNPVVLGLPYRQRIDQASIQGGITMILSGNTSAIHDYFAAHPSRWLRVDEPTGPKTELVDDSAKTAGTWLRLGPAQVQPAGLRTATDDWPFLYLHHPMIPSVSLRGAAVMGGVGVLLILLFLPRGSKEEEGGGFDGRLFFLGAGFMLIETTAVVRMALLFGSTWMVNSVVFFAVLVMILAANLFVLRVRPERLAPYYIGLLVTLVLNLLVPLDFFLGMGRTVQVAGSCLLVFSPILFAGVIFAVLFGRTRQPDRAFGANVAGAMLGGLAEYSSMLLGFQYLLLVAVAFYLLSMVRWRVPAVVPDPAAAATS